MAQHRQSGAVVNGAARNGDHVAVGVRGGSRHFLHRRSRSSPQYKISIGSCILILSLILSISAFFYFWLQSKGGETSAYKAQDDDLGDDKEFLLDIKEIQRTSELKFGRGSVTHAGDSRYWDKDDRRRDEDYSEEESERSRNDSMNEDDTREVNKSTSSHFDQSHASSDHRGNGLYNEAGRNELKKYEAQYEASLKNTSGSGDHHSEDIDENDEYDDGIDFQDDSMEHFDYGNDQGEESDVTKPQNVDIERDEKAFTDTYHEGSQSDAQHEKVNADSGHISSTEGQPGRKVIPGRHSGSKKKSKRRRFSGCAMKVLNSSTLIVEPLESRKFARFSLQYTQGEEKPVGMENWEPRFAGHQNLGEREESFVAHDQKINCGFVQGPKGLPSTGFDLAEDDAKYISSCHIAVSSCIFGNSDRLRSPIGKTVSRLSRKNVCFVMFTDEATLQTLSSEGQMPDMMGFIGLWKIVVVKNLPYADMRRVGKIPKFLSHRLFPSARYSIWLDSKLRLQLDPLVILEYFLWRKGYEYAISNHYDRHCLWDEVGQNKRLNKYNHSMIDRQFAFYQADGMKKFNASDPNKLLPSNVPEGSFIVRAHTPMSNLFSCLWFNEVDRFTPRDQLSFAYTYHKLRRKNPEKMFYLNMFKDCERRKIAKLYRHRSEEKRNLPRMRQSSSFEGDSVVMLLFLSICAKLLQIRSQLVPYGVNDNIHTKNE